MEQTPAVQLDVACLDSGLGILQNGHETRMMAARGSEQIQYLGEEGADDDVGQATIDQFLVFTNPKESQKYLIYLYMSNQPNV